MTRSITSVAVTLAKMSIRFHASGTEKFILEGKHGCVSGGYSDGDFEKMKVIAGLELVQPTDVGVFHYEQSNRDSAQCAVLANHGTRVYSHRFIVVIFVVYKNSSLLPIMCFTN